MKINQLINQVIDLNIVKGVQPNELTEAIFDDSYLSISMKKDALNNLCLELSFLDDDNSINTMRYKYNQNSVLFRIEQKINKGHFIVQWDRKKMLLKLYSDIRKELLSNRVSKKSIDNFLLTLPKIKSYDQKVILKLLA
ncbi:hypothetical protein [Wohlfahrtiimonas chitiniclastica]|uniref:hypothetical protein n=1 Tax=Wohlfahrtiimonas chitiniclastica TaxID=400946 RepID=UPI001BCBBD54|nr:hypothetical protein [Wohlfahrtiimonas chitiniclastica]MBS7837227.1 hypothetical protein [Wohlfahrtiimonas chitiniclastica]